MDTKKVKADEKAFMMIVDQIVAHRIRPGDRIYEPDLAETLKLSRTPVRHALSRLVAEGVLDKARGRRGYTLPVLSKEDMEEVFATRSALEGKAIQIAAEKITDHDISYLRELNERERSLFHLGRYKSEYAQVNEQFHSKIVELAGNRYIERYFRQAYWRSSLYTFHFGLFYNIEINVPPESAFPDSEHRTYREHRKIIDALERRDGPASRALLEEHVYNTIVRRGVRFSAPI